MYMEGGFALNTDPVVRYVFLHDLIKTLLFILSLSLFCTSLGDLIDTQTVFLWNTRRSTGSEVWSQNHQYEDFHVTSDV